jgi:hypothetical protein
MRGVFVGLILVFLASCNVDEISYVSIRNDTGIPILALPYSSDLTEGEWIQPGVTDEFYSLNCDCLNGYDYFSFYYDSLIVYLKDHDQHPVKFFKDGTTINYNPTMNPFTNPEIWQSQQFRENVQLTALEGTERRTILEHFFPIDARHVKSLSDTIRFPLNPAS